jgi:anti-anti-sigma factor
MRINSDKFTIYEVEELHKEFISELKSGEAIEVDIEGVKKIDMPAIQLLISTLKSCEVDSTPFSISNISDEVKETLKISGCDTLLGVNNE